MLSNRKENGFTLVELLVVVAIISILSAIAIPNFLAAQVRSKVARVKAELRTVTTALESYCVDNNDYPLTTGYPPLPAGPIGILPNVLSTPITYLTSVSFKDPFARPGIPIDQQYCTYQNINQYCQSISPQSEYWKVALQVYGSWRACSIGPNNDYYNDGMAPTVQYDPSNGTVSPGNIWIGQSGFTPPTGPIYNGR